MTEKICPGCGEKIDWFPTHARMCEKYKKKKKEALEKLTKDFLIEEYVNKEKSCSQISKEIGLEKIYYIQNKLKEYGIKERDQKENRKAKGYIELCKKTSLNKYGSEYHTAKESNIRDKIFEGVKKKYGVECVLNSKEIQDKIKKTNLEKYGAENVFSNDSIIKKEILKKVKEKYGVDNVWQNLDIINKCKKTKTENRKTYAFTSNIASMFFLELFNLIERKDNIYFQPLTKEYCVMSKENTLYIYDFVDSFFKKCIEFNGDYWHANPIKYSSNWVNQHLNLTASEIWEKDKKKNDSIKEERGYDVLVIWENAVRKEREKMLNLCVQFLNS